MKILVSACLLGENCKYSGGNNYNQAVCDFARGHQVVPVCPEVLGGLPKRPGRLHENIHLHCIICEYILLKLHKDAILSLIHI